MSKQVVLKSFAELAPYFDLPAPDVDVEGASDSNNSVESVWSTMPAEIHEPVAETAIADTFAAIVPVFPAPAQAVGSEEAVSAVIAAPPEPTVPPIDETGDAGTENQSGGDVSALLAELEAAGQALAAAMRRDREVRAAALRGLEQYDAAVAARMQAEEVCARAAGLRRDAEALAESAFADQEREAAAAALAVAIRAEDAARGHAERCRAEAEHLVERLDLQRALAERQRAEAAEKERVAEAERARRLSAALAEAREALGAGRFEEAQALLGPLAKEHPGNADIASLQTIIARLRASVKATAAEDALWAARREYRHDPAAAVDRLAALDVDGLPEPLARQVFGQWARACRRRCERDGLSDALRYAPRAGRGAVLTRRTPAEPYVVLSAIGMGDAWAAGTVVAERTVRCARLLSSC